MRGSTKGSQESPGSNLIRPPSAALNMFAIGRRNWLFSKVFVEQRPVTVSATVSGRLQQQTKKVIVRRSLSISLGDFLYWYLPYVQVLLTISMEILIWFQSVCLCCFCYAADDGRCFCTADGIKHLPVLYVHYFTTRAPDPGAAVSFSVFQIPSFPSQ